jgi:exopolyphosphatase / guanosine-5'-triphosphate,3'-diphosphate pyrophosphatase
LRLACIDIGSNTTRLLVAESDGTRLRWVHQERAFTRIGYELFARGSIGPAKIAEVVEVVRGQRDRARQQGAGLVRAVATEAIRSAGNGRELTAAIERATGVSVEVLSPEEEARLAFVGVAGTLTEPRSSELGVVDVGGGSSELVVGRPPDRVRWWTSVALGSAELSHRVLASDPPTPDELESARAEIARELAQLRIPHPAEAVAVGGSATSLSRLAGPRLDAEALDRALEQLARQPAAQIGVDYAIDLDRARLLPAGLLILEGVVAAFGIPLLVGRGGIREGVLLEASRT